MSADPDPPPSPFARFTALGLRGQRALFEPWQTLDLRRLGRVLGHSVLVGALAGVAAIGFFLALEWAGWFFLGEVGRLTLPRPGGELEVTPPHGGGPPRVWVLAILPAVGGLLCGLLTHAFAREATGPGAEAYLRTFHQEGGLVRKRIPLVKALASILTIGTGGSAGREGPTMQIGAGIGSVVSQALGLKMRERRVPVAGAAAGTGAIFLTPLGAALYAVEVLYRDDFETDALVPAILASVTGYSIFTTFVGPGPLFVTADAYPFQALALPLFAVMAIGLGLFGTVFASLHHGLEERVFARLPGPPWIRPAVGGLLLGALALFVPQALGVGYGWAQGAIVVDEWIPPSAWGAALLLGLAAAKMLATAFTISSGGSGGDFGPMLVIGGLVGGGFGLLFHAVAPALVPDPGAFALVGMGALVGGPAHAPVSSLIMVCEMTGSYDLLVPLMLAEAVTFVLLRKAAIFRRQVPARVDSPAHRDEVTIDVLESMNVESVYEREVALPEVVADTPLQDVLRVLSGASHPVVLVRDRTGRFVGHISLDQIQCTLTESGLEGLALAADMMMEPARLFPSHDLHNAMHEFLVTGCTTLPVVDPDAEGQPIIGVLSQVDVTRAYDDAMDARLGRASITAF